MQVMLSAVNKVIKVHALPPETFTQQATHPWHLPVSRLRASQPLPEWDVEALCVYLMPYQYNIQFLY